MRKFFTLFAAILLAGSVFAADYHLEKVTSVAAGKTYAFVRNDKALTTTSSSALQTLDVNLGTIDGSQTYLWKLVEATGGFKLNNVSRGEGSFLRNGSSSGLSLSNTDTKNIWTITFTGDIALIEIPENTRFLGETGEGSNQYKAYSNAEGDEDNLDTYGHDFFVYELKDGASVTPAIIADKLDLKTAVVKEFPFVTDTNIVVTTSNLTADITTSVIGSNITVPASLAKEGGKLSIHVSAAAEGKFSDTIVLTSGTLSKKVAIEANVVKPVGEGTKESPFTLADLAKINNGLSGKHWVQGFIVGCAATGGVIKEEVDSSSIALGTTASQTENLIAVKLVGGKSASAGEQKVRNDLNVHGNPSNIGKEVKVYGKLEAYYGTTGVTSTSDYAWVSAEPSSEAAITSLKVGEAVLEASENKFSYAAPNDAANELPVVFTVSKGATANPASGFKIAVPAAGAEAVDSTIVVTAEDGTTKATYHVLVTRKAADAPKSDVATIKSLTINGEAVAEKEGVFAVELPADSKLAEVEVAFSLTDPNAKADKANPFKITVPAAGAAAATEKITVTAEDGTTKKEYTVSVSKAKADDQAVDNINAANQAVKFIENGQIIILKNGVRYNVQGQAVR